MLKRTVGFKWYKAEKAAGMLLSKAAIVGMIVTVNSFQMCRSYVRLCNNYVDVGSRKGDEPN